MSASLQKPKPGLAACFLIPFALWILFGIVATVFLVMGITNAQSTYDDWDRFPSDTATTVTLNDTGGYRIWLVREDSSGSDFLESATATVTGPDGQDIPVSDYVGSLEYNDASAVLTFDAPTEGDYTVTAASLDGRPAEFVVAKENPFGDAGRGLLYFIAIGTFGFIVALIVFIVMMVQRGRSKRKINQAYGGGYPQQGGYPPQGGYGAPGGYPPPPGSSWG